MFSEREEEILSAACTSPFLPQLSQSPPPGRSTTSIAFPAIRSSYGHSTLFFPRSALVHSLLLPIDLQYSRPLFVWAIMATLGPLLAQVADQLSIFPTQETQETQVERGPLV